jgi:hypothetical protein
MGTVLWLKRAFLNFSLLSIDTFHTSVLDLDPNPFNLDSKIKKWATLQRSGQYTLARTKKALNKNRLLLSNLFLGSQHAWYGAVWVDQWEQEHEQNPGRVRGSEINKYQHCPATRRVSRGSGVLLEDFPSSEIPKSMWD